MAKVRIGAGLLVSCLFLGSSAAVLAQSNSANIAKVLNYKPRQEGIVYTIPTPEEQAKCTLKIIPGTAPGSSGWLLLDAQNRPLRRFVDTNGDRAIDVWSYFKDGVEVYREISKTIDPSKEKADHYRWFGANGTKWGLDYNGDGKIDAWKVISPEEVGQEIFQAVATKNFARLKALFLTEADLLTLKLSTAEAKRIRDAQAQAESKFQKTTAKLPNLDKARYVRLESVMPQCIPAENPSSDLDLIKYPARTILYEVDKRHDWLQVGEMIQVGNSWKVIDAPVPGDSPEAIGSAGTQTPGSISDPELQKRLEALASHDKSTPAATAPNAEIIAYNLKRAELIRAVMDKSKADEQEQWIRQLADCLSAAYQAGEQKALTQLTQLKEQTVKNSAGTPLAAYLTYREMWAEFAPRLANPKDDFAKIQDQWFERLTKFVQNYPTAEDAADAFWQLAMGSEFAGKEEQARKWYQQLVSGHGNHPLVATAKGAIRRLESKGQTMELTGPKLDGSGSFNLTSLRGKVVVVYYWASKCKTCPDDFARLKKLYDSQHAKGLELVSINLDDRAEEASKYLQATPLPGTHLFQPSDQGGMNSPLAIQYGIIGLPTTFLVGKDGKVVNPTIQMSELEEAIRKQL
jgi:thiol-disulfide isomerase/thioredoxin